MENLEQTAKGHLDQSVLRKNLAEQADQSLTLAYNGGLFKITLEFICAIHFADLDPLIIKDEYNNPVMIVDKTDFVDKMVQKYQEVMNDWHHEFEQLKTIRKPDQL